MKSKPTVKNLLKKENNKFLKELFKRKSKTQAKELIRKVLDGEEDDV